MNRKLKTITWIIVTLVIVAIAGWNIFLHIISEAFGTKCDTNETWRIENYQIIERKCIGFAGPYFYPVYLYKDDKELDRIAYKSDSCIVNFANENGDTLRFDLCAKKIE